MRAIEFMDDRDLRPCALTSVLIRRESVHPGRFPVGETTLAAMGETERLASG